MASPTKQIDCWPQRSLRSKIHPVMYPLVELSSELVCNIGSRRSLMPKRCCYTSLTHTDTDADFTPGHQDSTNHPSLPILQRVWHMSASEKDEMPIGPVTSRPSTFTRLASAFFSLSRSVSSQLDCCSTAQLSSSRRCVYGRTTTLCDIPYGRPCRYTALQLNLLRSSYMLTLHS